MASETYSAFDGKATQRGIFARFAREFGQRSAHKESEAVYLLICDADFSHSTLAIKVATVDGAGLCRYRSVWFAQDEDAAEHLDALNKNGFIHWLTWLSMATDFFDTCPEV